jgi:hypothetical protein
MVRGRVEAALPAPLVDVDPDAGTGRDRPDVHATAIDVPAVGAIGRAAAGEGGHAHLIARRTDGEAAMAWGRSRPGAHDQAEGDARDHAVSVGASG